MSTKNAEMYGRRAAGADSVEELGGDVKGAIDALVSAIKSLEKRVSALENSRSSNGKHSEG
jgi:hypothetical protein